MNDRDSARAVRKEAQSLANFVAAQTALHALEGVALPPYLTAAGKSARDVMLRAGEIEAKEPEPMVAAMETIDPVEFGRKVRARRRMAALRKKGKRQAKPAARGEDLFPKPPPTKPAVTTKVVRRG